MESNHRYHFSSIFNYSCFLETLGIHQKTFKVTNKKKMTMHTRSLLYMIPHLVLIVLTILAIIRYGAGKYGSALFYSSIILFSLVILEKELKKVQYQYFIVL